MAVDRSGVSREPVHLSRLRFFEHTFRSTELAVVVADLEKEIRYLNPAAERLLGWEAGELVGRSAAELTPPNRQRIDLDRLLETGERWAGERMSRRKDGSVHATLTAVSVARDDGGEPLGFLGLLADDAENQRWRSRLASLIGIGADLNAQSDPEALLLRICRDARAFFDVDGAYLTRWDEKTRELTGVVADGFRAESWPGRRLAIAEPNWASTAAARERRVIIREDAAAGPSDGHKVYFQVKSILAAPLLRQNRLLGVLAFTDTQRTGRFGPEDAEWARAYVELAAVALEDARLHEAERAKNERLLTLAHVSRLLTASLERELVLEAIASGAQRLLEVDVVRLWLLDSPEGPLRPAYVCPESARTPPRQLDLRHSRIGEVIRTGQPWQDPDAAREGVLQPELQDPELHGCLMVPLIARGRPLGGLTFFSKQVREFDPEDVELAQAFADQAALAVQNAERLARERQASRLERLLQRSGSLSPRDRHHVEQVLEAAERIIELGTDAYVREARSRSNGRGQT